MPDWDVDSPELQGNLTTILHRIRDAARRREAPTVEAARAWHVVIMAGLAVPDTDFVGKFRGEDGLENVNVVVGTNPGVQATDVAEALRRFQERLHNAVGDLDQVLPPETDPDADSLAAILELCAWAHAEWIRIHPFANGNGRTARLWANSLAMRYGLPPFVRLRPRPDDGYGKAGDEAMRGNWRPTAAVFRRMLSRFFT